ncbi:MULTISPECIES: hypothetical protein [Azospirillum]|uniref:Uncharacterized protein n=1 Tax=Azospirillum brasilense TaxID=192 RepID=Q6QW42_AZOBR|nr:MULTISPECIES: hypothetical protein [Azospirillum]YP_001686846.1 hypothetical protein APCd_gp05 [Azospirillum phage Cd]AAS83078.1 hypothetical protein pRhico090 [Azospirillum brasilense]MDW7555418.1 hypothetical protein [Azospirillum brasilense]MDW7595174.1 hypothetical protein [Azospirillum brasilense]MDW7630327.1 hypothetical protein [Azospirillum brasilense]MDX5949695.1 hypothetical protein [Azospirillum brasilense]
MDRYLCALLSFGGSCVSALIYSATHNGLVGVAGVVFLLLCGAFLLPLED